MANILRTDKHEGSGENKHFVMSFNVCVCVCISVCVCVCVCVVSDRSSSWYFKTLETMWNKQRNSGIVQPAEGERL